MIARILCWLVAVFLWKVCEGNNHDKKQIISSLPIIYEHGRKHSSEELPNSRVLVEKVSQHLQQLHQQENAPNGEGIADGSEPKQPRKRMKLAPKHSDIVQKLQQDVIVPRALSLRRSDHLPVLGPIPTNGTKPIYGKHTGRDAIFALACNYHLDLYKYFVGTLRMFGYHDDIVLAVSPPHKMKPGVEEYLKEKNVVSYAFDVDCAGKDNCRFKDDFLGYPDPRPFRTFANIRYALYEYWLRFYTEKSYILILDFRDTFFQSSPFTVFGNYESRTPRFDLHVFAENYKVKNIGKCHFNSMWVGRCFGHEALDELKPQAVLCSGSTLGSYQGISFYVETMLRSMDTVQCWKKGIESDQGYQNYLFYKGYFNSSIGNAIKFDQGNGVVNTIGAMNGFRVPKDQKGPLDTFWKIRDSEGFILNNDGTRSACIHQWDRFFDEIVPFLNNLVGLPTRGKRKGRKGMNAEKRSINVESIESSVTAPLADTNSQSVVSAVKFKEARSLSDNMTPRVFTPVLGAIPLNGTKPFIGAHTGRDAIFALAAGYSLELFQFFVGSLRKFGYTDDIVLAVSPPNRVGEPVANYLRKKNVVAYGFDVDCEKKDSCKFKDDFLGYPDPRPYRPFANIRYALYEYWMRYYTPNSYILILDFRDTFFQKSPFEVFGQYELRTPKYDLHVFAENHNVKTIGSCVFNSGWVGECFGKDALAEVKDNAVICSGSTLGSYSGIRHYVTTMLTYMDKIQCWRKNVESDQGYQSYLFYKGIFDTPEGKAIKFDQGHGVVNTIGAMNGFRVPAEKKGPLDTFWKIRDAEGFILNYDGTRSAVVHQWDRFWDEVYPFLKTSFKEPSVARSK